MLPRHARSVISKRPCPHSCVKCKSLLQALRRQMMPPMLSSLGPITDWLSSRSIGAFSAKYSEVSQASSAAKVHHLASNALAWVHDGCTIPMMNSTFSIYKGAREGSHGMLLQIAHLSEQLDVRLLLWHLTGTS